MSGIGEAGIGIAVYNLLEKIVKTLRDVKHFKGKCRTLCTDCQRLQIVLNSNSAALESSAIETALRQCLDEVYLFVAQCTRKWSYLHNGWEVIWEKKFPELQSKLSELVKALMLESVLAQKTETRTSNQRLEELGTSLSALTTSNTEAHDQDVEEREADRRHRREITDALLSEMNLVKVSASAPKFKISFSDTDHSNGISEIQDLTPLTGSRDDLIGSLPDGTRVMCKNLPQNRAGIERSIPRPAMIYSRLAQGSNVQNYFGILERRERYYAVMEDMRELPTLDRWLADHGVPDRLSALTIAYEISSTVAYFHSVQLLVKTISDQRIVLKTTRGTTIPLFTEVERARIFQESSQRTSYDIRYEAPEYPRQRQHTKFTDIWSIGVILWQIFSAKRPFQLSAQEASGQEDAFWQKLEQGHLAWSDESSGVNGIPAEVQLISQMCCSKLPLSRPTASEVANQLLNLLTMEAASGTSDGPGINSVQWDIARSSRISNDIAAGTKVEVADFLFLIHCAGTHSNAAYLAGTAIWKKLVEVEEIAEYSDIYSQATYVNPQEKRAHRTVLYLQQAANAGVDDACAGISEAFKLLSEMYTGRHNFAKRQLG